MDVRVALDLRPAEQVGRHPAGELEARRVERGRRRRPEIDRIGARLAGAMDQRVADPAQPGIPRLDRRERERGRDRRVDRIAAGVEHRDAGLGRAFRLRDHHPASARGGGLFEVPVLGRVGRGNELHAANDTHAAASRATPCSARPLFR